ISLSTKHAAKPPSGPDPPFSGVWRSSPAPEMISLSSFIYGCSSWWYLVCSPATSLPHQVHARLRNEEIRGLSFRWCNGGVVLCGEQNMPTSFRSFRSPVTSPYQPADEGLVEKGRLISGVCFLSNLVGFVVLAWYRDDVVIRSATEPEVNPKPFSTSQGAKQNTCSLKMPYLTN
ncbi:unnamed protein product, partial [Brassica oleracea]